MAATAGANEIETPATIPPDEPEEEARDTEPLDVNPTLGATVGWTFLTTEDMQDTYGGIPWLGIASTFDISRQTSFFVMLEYGAASGDPYHDVEDFSGPETELRVVPLTFGLKVNASQNQNMAFYFGAGFQVAWVEEKIPTGDDDSASAYRSDTGRGLGFVLGMGPEWRSADHRRRIGLELGWGGCDVEVGAGNVEHQASTVGAKARLYVSWRL